MAGQVVVGAAMIRDGRVLAARRRGPPELAGGWEFPGGKVEAGEDDRGALMRECDEELGVRVQVGELVGSAPLPGGWVLRIYLATLSGGEPAPRAEHDELRWLLPEELGSVPWLAPDLPIVDTLRHAL
jgi:8-oxo-dGTP diphosphatase